MYIHGKPNPFPSSPPTNSLISPLRTQLRIPGKLIKLTLINTLQLRTPQLARDRAHRTRQLTQRRRDGREQSLEEIRRRLLRGLVREAGGVIALEEGLRVVDAAGEVGDVDACEGVDFAGVAADGEADDFMLGGVAFSGGMEGWK